MARNDRCDRCHTVTHDTGYARDYDLDDGTDFTWLCMACIDDLLDEEN